MPALPRLVSDLMRSDPFTLPAELPASEVARRIDAHGARHVLVVDAEGRLVGLVNRARLLRHLVARRLAPEATPDLPIGELVVSRVVTTTPATPLVEALRLMREHRIGSLPVVDPATFRVAGLLSERMLLPLAEALLAPPVPA